MKYTDQSGNPLRTVSIDLGRQESVLVRIENDGDFPEHLLFRATPGWLVADKSMDISISQHESQNLVLRVDWSKFPDVSDTCIGHAEFASDTSNSQWTIEVAASRGSGARKPVAVLGSGTYNFGLREQRVGPLAKKDGRPIRHTMTVSAERGAFAGRIRTSDKWIGCRVCRGLESTRSLDLDLSPGEAANIDIDIRWHRLKPGIHRGRVEIVSLPGDEVVGCADISFSIVQVCGVREFLVPAKLDFGNVWGMEATTRSVGIFNYGGSAITAEVIEAPDWLDVEESIVEIAPRSGQYIHVTARSQIKGRHTGWIRMSVRSAGETRALDLRAQGYFSVT